MFYASLLVDDELLSFGFVDGTSIFGWSTRMSSYGRARSTLDSCILLLSVRTDFNAKAKNRK